MAAAEHVLAARVRRTNLASHAQLEPPRQEPS